MNKEVLRVTPQYVMLWCHDIMDDVGDHLKELMSEQSVLCGPDDMCPHFVLPACMHNKLSRNFSF